MTRNPPRSRLLALTATTVLLGGLTLLSLGTPAGATGTCGTVGALAGTDTQTCCWDNSQGNSVMTDTQCCEGDNVTLGAYSYLINGVPGLLSSAQAGDTLTVLFHVNGACGTLELSFVSYNTTSDHNLPDQTVYSQDTGSFGPGDHSLEITVPPCYFQIDFVYGKVIEKFDPDNGVTYHDQGRFIDGTQGGSACETTTTTTTTTTEIPFFPSGAALVVGVLGAVVGALFVLRRRL